MRNTDGSNASNGMTNEPECLRRAQTSKSRLTMKKTMKSSPKIVMNHALAGLTYMDR